MKCPYCNHQNPSNVTVCICGYKFKGYVESKDQMNLSKKYAILHILKNILWIFLVFHIVGGLIAISNVSQISGIGGYEILIIGIVGIVWIFGLFGIYCAIKIIDFLFELNKNILTRNDNLHPKG